MAKTTVSRDVVLGMLEKMGASFTPDITTERAIKKLTRHIEKNGLPDDYTPAEVEVMIALNLAEVDPKEAAKAAKAAKSEAKKGSGKKEKAPKAPKAPKAKAVPLGKVRREKALKGECGDWMISASKALLKHQDIATAEKETLKTYLANGGRKVLRVENNAKLSVSRAVRVLIGFGVAELNDDATKIILK